MTTYPLPNPFFVLATQNPLEHEGTYPLPEAQVDRFMMKVVISLSRPASRNAPFWTPWRRLNRRCRCGPSFPPRQILKAREIVNSIYVDD